MTGAQGTKKVLARGRVAKVKEKINQNTWQGNIVAHRLKDETLELAVCFKWSMN